MDLVFYFFLWFYFVVVSLWIGTLACRISRGEIGTWWLLGYCFDIVLLLFIYCPWVRHVA